MSYKSVNNQPEYINECRQNHYNVLVRYYPKNKNFDRKHAHYMTGFVTNVPEHFAKFESLKNNFLCIIPHGADIEQRDIDYISMIDLRENYAEILNLDELM